MFILFGNAITYYYNRYVMVFQTAFVILYRPPGLKASRSVKNHSCGLKNHYVPPVVVRNTTLPACTLYTNRSVFSIPFTSWLKYQYRFTMTPDYHDTVLQTVRFYVLDVRFNVLKYNVRFNVLKLGSMYSMLGSIFPLPSMLGSMYSSSLRKYFILRGIKGTCW